MQHAIDLVTSAILFLFGIVVTGIGMMDGYLSHLMTSAGIDPQAQMVILVCVAILLIILAVRLLGGLIATLVVILLVLLLVHRMVPDLHVPQQLTIPGQPAPTPSPAPAPAPGAGGTHT